MSVKPVQLQGSWAKLCAFLGVWETSCEIVWAQLCGTTRILPSVVQDRQLLSITVTVTIAAHTHCWTEVCGGQGWQDDRCSLDQSRAQRGQPDSLVHCKGMQRPRYYGERSMHVSGCPPPHTSPSCIVMCIPISYGSRACCVLFHSNMLPYSQQGSGHCSR